MPDPELRLAVSLLYPLMVAVWCWKQWRKPKTQARVSRLRTVKPKVRTA